MTTTAAPLPSQLEARRQQVYHAVGHAAHLLPAQGPIGVFIHHNTLHAFQHLPFENAVCEASEVFRTEPFLTEDAYREHLRAGRIRAEDIETVLDGESTEPILPGRLDRRALRKKLLLVGQRRFESATIQWCMEETDLLQVPRPGAAPQVLPELFATCQELVELQPDRPRFATRPRDAVLAESGIDLDDVIHPLLIRLCGAFLDQGMAYWPMPNRHQGFLESVRTLLAQGFGLFPEHLKGLGREFRRQAEAKLDPVSVVLSIIERFGIAGTEWDRTIQAELLALPGWAGMMYRLEMEPELAPHQDLPCSLMDYLAVRMTLNAVAAANIMEKRGLAGLMHSGAFAGRTGTFEADRLAVAARLFDAFQLLGLTTAELDDWNPKLRQHLVDEVISFNDLERRRLLHLAYERRHELDVLGPLATYRKSHPPATRVSRPIAQVFFCIDEREESMRRNLEEIAPDVETLSAAGFYGVAMHYAGIDDAHGVPLCPVVIKPQHAVQERPQDEHRHVREVRRRRRKLMARSARATFVSSRTLLRGWASTAGMGLLSLFPLTFRVIAPRSYGRLRRTIQNSVIPQPTTELSFIRNSAPPRATDERLLQGFTTQEKIDRVAGMLGPAGLREGFARLVVILGHGSTSLNNPHESAHDCGACGGRRGGPNGRIFAAMANRPEVREGLAARGIRIPDDTWFVGGYHDTCNDEVDLYDLDRVPVSHREELGRLRETLNRARALDAMERARRFEAARSDGDPAEALRHVQARAEHLAEPRPEYGHATNAVCMVGRREVTRGLFLDRRAFLISYDAELDPQDDGLRALLGAAVPVCAGISLEYYFSFVDNEGYGCGTKLPHNITGLLGVMNGHASDLRTGLPLQMVEVHEPVRILFVVESTPERVMKVISANPGLSELVENKWVRLATLDPETGKVQVKRGTGFEPLGDSIDPLPAAAASIDWYRGKLQHLPIARITGDARA